MAEKYDAGARLGEALPDVADFEQYVLACRSLGYQHPDLTAHPGQVRDRYLHEAGMDLLALDADCAALQAVCAAVEDALARQREQPAALATAWRGAGADASRVFLARHGESSQRAADAVRTAVEALADLRDRLWQAVDAKVAAVLAIGDGTQPRRAEWMAAAQTVTTGSGDRAIASELVDQEVKPFVDNAIGDQYLTAMRAATVTVETVYRQVVAALAAASGATFDVPGELGPVFVPAEAVAATPAPVVPAAFVSGGTGAWSPPTVPPPSAPPSPAAPPAAAAPAVPAPAVPPAEPVAPASAPAPPSAPSMGAGAPDIGSGISSFGQQLGEMLGGLFGDGALGADIDELDDPAKDEFSPDEESALTDEDEESALTDEDDETGEEEPGEPVDPAAAEVTDTAADPAVPGAESAAAPVCPPEEATAVDNSAETAPPEPLAVATDEPAAPPPSGTPCEIAADELPQVGE
ncbi:hypothetical protein H7J88_20380 [Mycolicibacterium flavescens]|uniref:hypothetical protein n=1 Tax=Mycolicibacterium flavescens TaxID=1776 RepID=UPI0021F29D52|nr:hypothetical protein [Mycolicibacterium flavescens]MCV7281990.1 hypothetical protein [Mycolicibacterium flavescens]